VIVTIFCSAAERYLQTILFDDLRNQEAHLQKNATGVPQL